MEKSLQGGNNLNAKELTEAIEAATDLATERAVENNAALGGAKLAGRVRL